MFEIRLMFINYITCKNIVINVGNMLVYNKKNNNSFLNSLFDFIIIIIDINPPQLYFYKGLSIKVTSSFFKSPIKNLKLNIL